MRRLPKYIVDVQKAFLNAKLIRRYDHPKGLQRTGGWIVQDHDDTLYVDHAIYFHFTNTVTKFRDAFSELKSMRKILGFYEFCEHNHKQTECILTGDFDIELCRECLSLILDYHKSKLSHKSHTTHHIKLVGHGRDTSISELGQYRTDIRYCADCNTGYKSIKHIGNWKPLSERSSNPCGQASGDLIYLSIPILVKEENIPQISNNT